MVVFRIYRPIVWQKFITQDSFSVPSDTEHYFLRLETDFWGHQRWFVSLNPESFSLNINNSFFIFSSYLLEKWCPRCVYRTSREWKYGPSDFFPLNCGEPIHQNGLRIQSFAKCSWMVVFFIFLTFLMIHVSCSVDYSSVVYPSVLDHQDWNHQFYYKSNEPLSHSSFSHGIFTVNTTNLTNNELCFYWNFGLWVRLNNGSVSLFNK